MGIEFDRLAREIIELSKEPLGEKPTAFAKTSLLDWVGVAIAGAKHGGPMLQAIGLHSAGTVSVDCCATLIGNGRLSDPVSAALHNGIAGHILDFDDVLITRHQPLHPTAPIAPAVLAIAESLPVSGNDVLRALILGVETVFRMTETIDSAHFSHGWHVTATLGTVGASVGSGLLLGLDPQQLRRAMWLGATQMGGVRASLGTFAKPFQVGKAAATGLTCALLARANAPLDPCLDQGDWLRMAYSMHGEFAAAPRGPKRLAIEAVLYKRYPCCGEAHDAINSILHMENPPPWQSIRKMRIHAPEASIALAGVLRPANSFAARFSIPYCTSVALLHGKVGLAEFREPALADPRTAGLLERTELISHRDKGTRVELELQDGKTLSVMPDPAKNLRDIASRHQFVREKFTDNVEPLVGPALCTDLMEGVSSLERSANVGRLSAALRRIRHDLASARS
jgi:2-methylcitrate dehydratase PrpD